MHELARSRLKPERKLHNSTIRLPAAAALPKAPVRRITPGSLLERCCATPIAGVQRGALYARGLAAAHPMVPGGVSLAGRRISGELLTHQLFAGPTEMHTMIVGKTGMGKSTLIKRIAAEVIASGAGTLLLDPHGDLVDELEQLVPRRRSNDIVLFDPRDPDRCPGVNPLRNVLPNRRAVLVSGILATFRKLWPENWGPRTEHLLRYALLALCEVRGATLADARDMLVDERHRAWVLKQVRDGDVMRFWAKEFTGYSKQLQADAVAAPLNKLGAFIANVNVRAVLTKGRPLIDATKCLAKQRIVLARLSKGSIGEDGAGLVGGLLLGLFQQATMGRESLPVDARLPFTIVADEIGSFAARPFVELLAEARKYSVSVVMAGQSLAVMDPAFRAGILGNVGRLVTFRVGAEDAELLQKEFAGRFGAQTLTSLDIGEHIVKEGAKPAMLVDPTLGTIWRQ